MKVGIDLSKMHSMNKGRGVGFYAENLINALRKYTAVEVEVIKDNLKPDVDLIHYPYFDLFRNTLILDKNLPAVVTVHDVTPLVFIKHYPPGIKGLINLFKQKQTLKKASAVITDSIASKKDIIKFLKYPDEKIYPVYLAPAERFKVIDNQSKLEKAKIKYNLTDKFACFIGNVNWNKNILGIAESCINADIDLFLIGGGFKTAENLNHPELKSLKEFKEKFSNNPRIHILGYIEDQEIVEILNLATVFVFPTFYEGFGMPVLEAQSCGVPVVTSNTSSIPEIVGDSAIMVDPFNVDEISGAILEIISNKDVRDKLVQKGFKNVERFSWKKCAEETVKVYQEVLNGKSN